MTQQAVLQPTTTRRPVSSLLSSLSRRSPSATPNTRSSRRPGLAHDRRRTQVTETYPAVTGHQWAILMTMRPHS